MANINLNTYRLRGYLKKRSKGDYKGLYERYKQLWEFASKNFLKFMNIENYTDHGETHVLNIEKNIHNLIKEEIQDETTSMLTPFDIFCLLSACCLHDIGMIAKKRSKETYSSTRADHHIRVRQLLKDRYREFHLNQQEALIIGAICYGHGCSSLDELEMYDNWTVEPYGKVNTILLTSLLRIGDLLDLSFLRAPKLVSDLKKIKGVSLNHWKLHDKISGVEINRQKKEIGIYANVDSEYELSELNKLRNWIEKELEIVLDVFKKNGIIIEKISLNTNLDKKNVLSRENPFIRLASFEWSEHVAFFGRDKEISDIKEKVLNNKLLVLVGESGVGKTSLLNAGLKQELIESGHYVFDLRLSETFQKDFYKDLKTQFSEYKPKDLFKLLEKISSEKFDMVVFIDQFEEVFTLYSELNFELLSFFDGILSNREISLKLVLSLREDFMAELWELSENLPDLYDRYNTYRLKKLSRENAKQVIRNTIEYIEYSIDDELVDKLLDDFTKKEENIYPPYIQIVCHRIFKRHKEIYRENSSKVPLNFVNYERLGRAQKIIAEYFEEILNGFTLGEREVINDVLAPMITYFHTKQRISYERILEINNNRIDIENVLNRLINLRIINKIETEKNEYELIHDFLAKKILESKSTWSISSKIKKAIDYIDNNFQNPITLQEIAGTVEFSREHFSRLFKVETKSNFVDYVNKKRIDAARKHLRDSRVKVNEIYSNVGFSNQQHFTKVFKKITGYTPTEYREHALENN